MPTIPFACLAQQPIHSTTFGENTVGEHSEPEERRRKREAARRRRPRYLSLRHSPQAYGHRYLSTARLFQIDLASKNINGHGHTTDTTGVSKAAAPVTSTGVKHLGDILADRQKYSVLVYSR